MNKFMLLNLLLSSVAIFSTNNMAQSKTNSKCLELNREYFEQFIEERKDLEETLKKVLYSFNNETLKDFISKVNNKVFNSKHTYPFLMEDSKVLAHGLKPVSYFKNINCEDHERNDALNILMGSIYTAKNFPITVFYHIDNRLRETIVQEVTKDNKTYYIGIGFFVE